MSKPARRDPRTDAQIRQHFEVERELAERLRRAPAHERRTLYAALYDELFRRVPHHPMLTRKLSPEQSNESLEWQIRLLTGFLSRGVTFLEVGPGDCTLAFEVARRVKKVYAVDVSKTITSHSNAPENFQLVLSDGSSIDVPKGSIDVIYSNQLVEHLHPSDLGSHLQNSFDALAPGGAYLCVTPNRLNGPHDISSYFDTVATGLHLGEHTVTELSARFRAVGFSRVMTYIGGRGRYWRCPVLPVIVCERVLQILPATLRRAIGGHWLVRGFIGVRLVGIKGRDVARAT